MVAAWISHARPQPFDKEVDNGSAHICHSAEEIKIPLICPIVIEDNLVRWVLRFHAIRYALCMAHHQLPNFMVLHQVPSFQDVRGQPELQPVVDGSLSVFSIVAIIKPSIPEEKAIYSYFLNCHQVSQSVRLPRNFSVRKHLFFAHLLIVLRHADIPRVTQES